MSGETGFSAVLLDAVPLADFLLGLLAHEQGRGVDDVVAELSLQLAGMAA